LWMRAMGWGGFGCKTRRGPRRRGHDRNVSQKVVGVGKRAGEKRRQGPGND